MDWKPENRAFALRLLYWVVGGAFVAGGAVLRLYEGMDDLSLLLVSTGTGLFGYASRGPGMVEK